MASTSMIAVRQIVTNSTLEHDRQVVLRGTSFVDGINVFGGSMATSYRVDVVGWILPS